MTRKKKILFLTLYPELQPSTRFRVIQFLPYLKEGMFYTVRPIVPEMIFNKFYGSKSRLKRLFFHLFEYLTRLRDIFISFKYDSVFLQKGIATIKYRGLHKLLFLFNKNIIFDFDDAVTIGHISNFKRFPWSLLEDKNQVAKIVRNAKIVIAGNELLRNDILNLNDNIVIIPTPVDTDYYQINLDRYKNNKEKVQILWSGNKSGHVHLRRCSKALQELFKKYSLDVIIFSDVYDKTIDEVFSELKINFIRWSIEKEKEVFSQADIGIMPLYDTLWDRRKCAFKALLYMANGIPVVSSPTGIIKDIIENGKNGFLAESEDEWQKKLELLIKDTDLRRKIGLSGRQTIEQKFSLSKWGPLWVDIIGKVGSAR